MKPPLSGLAMRRATATEKPVKPELPSCWVIGFSGHRDVANPEQILEALAGILKDLRHEVRGELIGYSSIAIGGDTLFARACMSLGFPWIAVLPLPQIDFRNDFSAPEWKEAETLLGLAAQVNTLHEAASRDEAYLECGLNTVDEADIVIALWNGKPARGVGGTGDIVDYARTLKKPLILIHPDTIEVRRENFESGFADPDMDYLNSLQAGGSFTPKPELDSRENARALLEQFFHNVDDAASRMAPRVRGWVAASVVMSAAAAILGAASVFFSLGSWIFIVLIIALTAGAILAVLCLKWQGAPQNWIRCRVAAEICRSVLVSWNLPRIAESVWADHDIPLVHRLIRSARAQWLTPGLQSAPDFERCKADYLRDRVDDQIRYYRRRYAKLLPTQRKLSAIFWIFSGAALIRQPVFTLLHSHWPGQRMPLLNYFFLVALPSVSACSLSMMSVLDLNRQLARAREMEGRLVAAREQIENCHGMRSLERAVRRTEGILASEIFEWFTLYKNPRFN